MTISEIKEKMELVNDNWLKTKPQKKTPGWSVACYFMGCMEAYKATGKETYLNTALEWAVNNEWKPDRYGDETYAEDVLVEHFTEKGGCRWRYENPNDYLNIHADYVTCSLTYLELLKYFPEQGDLGKLLQIMRFNVEDEHTDYWWWVDAIHMGLCVYHQVAGMLGDERYAQKAHALYKYIKENRGCYDEQEHLWYRDQRFLPEKALTQNGKKIFWARGNGWVYAGLIQTLSILAPDSVYYEEYKKTFLEMTESVIKCQGEDGFWRSSMLDFEEYPEKESSGTLLFLHSILRAIRCGILDKSYLGVFEKGFHAVNQYAVSEEGVVGWVQGVADRPGKTVKESSKDYAVGFYLMMCSEWIQYCEKCEKNK